MGSSVLCSCLVPNNILESWNEWITGWCECQLSPEIYNAYPKSLQMVICNLVPTPPTHFQQGIQLWRWMHSFRLRQLYQKTSLWLHQSCRMHIQRLCDDSYRRHPKAHIFLIASIHNSQASSRNRGPCWLCCRSQRKCRSFIKSEKYSKCTMWLEV